jgi:hypothetical protein
MSDNSPTGVVEQMLDHAAHARWSKLPEVLSPHFEIVEPESLPRAASIRRAPRRA